MELIALVPIIIFLGFVLVIVSLFIILTGRKKKAEIISKIDRYAVAESTATIDWESAEPSVQQFIARVTAWFSKYAQPKNEEELSERRKIMAMAGYRKPGNMVIFYGAKAFLAVSLPLLLLLISSLIGEALSEKRTIILIVLSALMGYFAPNAWVHLAIAKRQDNIREGFPDALDLMVVCVEAGMGLDQAIKRIADEMKLRNRVLSDEFSLMNLEIRAGRSRKDAMRNLAVRTGVEDVKSLVTLLIQTDKFGTSIAQALRIHASSMRTKRRQRAEEIAAKLPVKMLFPLILFIFPCLFIVVIGPGAIRIYRSLIQANL
jgi:tight adherence protein C